MLPVPGIFELRVDLVSHLMSSDRLRQLISSGHFLAKVKKTPQELSRFVELARSANILKIWFLDPLGFEHQYNHHAA